MRKEVLLAIIFGVALGGIILYGIRIANNASDALKKQALIKGDVTEITPSPTADENSLITISSPQNHSVSSEKEILLNGNTKLPNQNIAIVSELDDLIISSSPEGTFSAKINLQPGENNITLSTLDKNQTVKSQVITVIQSNNI